MYEVDSTGKYNFVPKIEQQDHAFCLIKSNYSKYVQTVRTMRYKQDARL